MSVGHTLGHLWAPRWFKPPSPPVRKMPSRLSLTPVGLPSPRRGHHYQKRASAWFCCVVTLLCIYIWQNWISKLNSYKSNATLLLATNKHSSTPWRIKEETQTLVVADMHAIIHVCVCVCVCVQICILVQLGSYTGQDRKTDRTKGAYLNLFRSFRAW